MPFPLPRTVKVMALPSSLVVKLLAGDGVQPAMGSGCDGSETRPTLPQSTATLWREGRGDGARSGAFGEPVDEADILDG